MNYKSITLTLAIAILSLFLLTKRSDQDMKQKRDKHVAFLSNNRMTHKFQLSDKEKASLGVPPNKYFEQQWLLKMNPELGYPTPQKLYQLEKELRMNRQQSATMRVPGDASDNNWEERGPNNVGGRTKALLFDPNDASQKTVFAGGVSGGLWKNSDITDANSPWVLMDIPENLSVTSIKVDPNDSNTFYVGTGESYLAGDVNGSGVWKSTDGGNTWFNVLEGITGDSYFDTDAEVVVTAPGSIAGTYAAVAAAFGPELTSFSGELVIVDDGSALPTEGCNALVNTAQVNGKIAVIDRGNCNFTVKVKNAQDAGAIGVIMVNNVSGNPIIQGGTDNTITIPSVMVSKTDGAIFKQEINAGNTVQVTINPKEATTPGAYMVPGNIFINDIAIRNNAGVSEIFVAVGDSFYAAGANATYMGGSNMGLYKSIDGGATWTNISLSPTASGNPICPNDLEIAADNSIYLSSTYSFTYDDGGGYLYRSTDGTNFVYKRRVTQARRTEIACSASNANKVYVLCATSSTTEPVKMFKTSDGFDTDLTALLLPNDADSGIPSNDFTRGQAFYDLTIEVDPTNDNTLYVGGIDLFKSINSGGFWTQISHWSGSYGYNYVHSDQHGMAFSSDGKMVCGCDGGVFYSDDNGSTIEERNNNYNVTQFYKVAVPPSSAFSVEKILAGAQDNGSLIMESASPGINSATLASGGDGGFCFFDQDGSDRYYITNYVYNQSIQLHNYVNGSSTYINSESGSNGDFINELALDSNLNILYSNYSTSSSNAIMRYSNLLGNVSQLSLTNALLDKQPSALVVSPYTTSRSLLFVGTRNSKLLKVNNANSSPQWEEITGADFLGSVSDIEFGQSEPEMFVTMYNYGVNNIFYTNDGGTSWSKKDGDLPDLPVNCILQNPLNPEQVIIGTDLGIWWTQNFSDANPNWMQADNGMRSVKVTDLQLKDDNKVYASTYGRGIFSGTFTAADGTVSIADYETIPIRIYPNPANSLIHLVLPIDTDVSPITYTIYDLNGKIVNNSIIYPDNKNLNLDISELAEGSYFIKLAVNDKLYKARFLKN